MIQDIFFTFFLRNNISTVHVKVDKAFCSIRKSTIFGMRIVFFSSSSDEYFGIDIKKPYPPLV